MKVIANEIFSVFEKYKNGQCSYDKALEDTVKIINKYSDERPIVGYVKSGYLKNVLTKIVNEKKQNENEPYIFDCRIHKNEMADLEKMCESMKLKQ